MPKTKRGAIKMFCYKCAATLKPGAKFCQKCGCEIVATGHAPDTPQEEWFRKPQPSVRAAPTRSILGERQPQTIEATSKKWKGWQLIGWISFFCLICMWFSSPDSAASYSEQMAMTPLKYIFFWVGAVCVFVGRVGAWWYNK